LTLSWHTTASRPGSSLVRRALYPAQQLPGLALGAQADFGELNLGLDILRLAP
jgi:hypothetical protein